MTDPASPSSPGSAPVPVTELGPDVELPAGFSFGAMRCGLAPGRPDLGLLRSDSLASAAGVFTRNPMRAACVERDAAAVPGRALALVVNSGNANALTGAEGKQADDTIASEAAGLLGATPQQVLTFSTGTIGVPLPADLVTRALPGLTAETGPDPAAFAQAILTTDTTTKQAALTVTLPGADAPIHILGIAKGSGMIHPNMATTLGFVCTDAAIEPEHLQRLLGDAVERTFNAISVDGDTSTNDSVVALANGRSGISIRPSDSDNDDPTEAAFAAALHAVLDSLAHQVVRDGEGATRLLEVEVRGAPTESIARQIARGVCRSNLVKCSTFAGHADWGRVAAAMGQAVLEDELPVNPREASISAQGIELYTAQGPVVGVKMAEVSRRMSDTTVRWTIDLQQGPAQARALGCDLSYDYVRINADDTPQVEVTHDGSPGGRSHHQGLSSYSPGLRHQLLVDGLAYVRRFVGLRMMVHVPPQGDVPQVVENLAQDLELCLDANLRPLLVVPREDMARQIHEHMQRSGHFSASVAPDASTINRLLDRGHLCVLVREQPVPHAMIDLSIKLGVHKVITLGAERGLHDAHGFVQRLSPETFLLGHERGRFLTDNLDLLVLIKHACTQGIPSLHVIDARVPHALVGELFTDDGIGTLITRQTIG